MKWTGKQTGWWWWMPAVGFLNVLIKNRDWNGFFVIGIGDFILYGFSLIFSFWNYNTFGADIEIILETRSELPTNSTYL